MMRLLVLLLVYAAARAKGGGDKKYVMPWMCLEICDSPEEIQEQLETIHEKSHILSGVSFEKYTLGSHCELVTNHTLTPITKCRAAVTDAYIGIKVFIVCVEFAQALTMQSLTVVHTIV